jgi:hypothetical protein
MLLKNIHLLPVPDFGPAETDQGPVRESTPGTGQDGDYLFIYICRSPQGGHRPIITIDDATQSMDIGPST